MGKVILAKFRNSFYGFGLAKFVNKELDDRKMEAVYGK